MKKSIVLFLTVFLIAFSLVSCKDYAPKETPAYNHVVIIGIDGAGRFIKDADTPNMDAIMAKSDCASGYNYECETPSISAHNWGAFLHGYTPDKLKCDNAKICIQRFTNPDYPSIFKVFRKAFPKAKLASIVAWSPINFGLIEPGLRVDKTPDVIFGGELYTDREVTDMVVSYLNNNDTKLMFVHFDEVDEMGHARNYGSPEYLACISKIDGYVGEIYDACDDDTLFIVVADHGGTPGGGHGGSTAEEMQITCIIQGKTVNPDGLTEFHPRDLPAIIYKAMNIEGPSDMDGHCPDSLFLPK